MPLVATKKPEKKTLRQRIGRGVAWLLLLSFEALAILYVLTNFPFPHLDFVYEGF